MVFFDCFFNLFFCLELVLVESGGKFGQLTIYFSDFAFSAPFVLLFLGTTVNPNNTISIFGRLPLVGFVNDGF